MHTAAARLYAVVHDDRKTCLHTDKGIFSCWNSAYQRFQPRIKPLKSGDPILINYRYDASNKWKNLVDVVPAKTAVKTRGIEDVLLAKVVLLKVSTEAAPKR